MFSCPFCTQALVK
uniref:Uncharacterized protein n=1 Tax=Anguilla anguilla TaxID=7936 RepID=A0A0E9UHP2_ANGAN